MSRYWELPGCGDPEAEGYTLHITVRRFLWLPWLKTTLMFFKDADWPETQRVGKDFAAAGASVEVHPFDCDGYDLYLGAPDTPENFPHRHDSGDREAG